MRKPIEVPVFVTFLATILVAVFAQAAPPVESAPAHPGSDDMAVLSGLAAVGAPDAQRGVVVWGDYDKDGDQDYLVIRPDGANHVIQAYRNHPDGLFRAVTECTTTPDGVTTCEGDQSAGVAFEFPTGPAMLKVLNLTTHITPAEGVAGIKMWSEGGADLRAEFVGGEWVISTIGDRASGIDVSSVGPNGANGPSRPWYDLRAGGAGSPGAAGGDVMVDSRGGISTDGVESHGIDALSQGGKGGNGGNSVCCNGGNAGTGGDGGSVLVEGNGFIETMGDSSYGIYARSEGGLGGNGGSSGAFGEGKNGGWGGRGGAVTVDGDWSVTTRGYGSHGIAAQSLGGGGGRAGNGSFFNPDPGSGGASGHGGSVLVNSRGEIETFGDESHGIMAQSVGGHGGTGGGANSVVNFSANGGSGGNGGVVTVLNSGSVTTWGDSSFAIFGQSVGGGGGSGGGGFGLFYSSGGGGSAGGNGDSVMIDNSGTLVAKGVDSRGIFAQSVGGGGGNGGTSLGIASFGGHGAVTSDGGAVSVVNSGAITTGLETADEDRPDGLTGSQAIFAQSVGGGGGNGGSSGGWFSLGGDGAGGGAGGNVTVVNTGQLSTHDDISSAIFAQSVGGGGGNGGGSVAAMSSLPTVAIGGSGAGGGDGGTVEVSHQGGALSTEGDFSHGIQAQSVGGGGGNGGFSVAASAVLSPVKVSIGGTAGGGGDGGMVSVLGGGAITTTGSDANGIMAQSVGGGGGSGGFSVAASYGGGVNWNFAMGGKGGAGGSGNTVAVGTELNPLLGTISTSGDRSHGIMAQSVGGGGGQGGFTVTGSLLGFTSMGVALGGSGGVGGGGDAVRVFSDADIATGGASAHGILAQSIGGGGGAAGWSLAAGVTAFGGTTVSLGGAGGPGAKGGTVDVASGGTIVTDGDFSHGIMAQSIGGGGGSGGMAGSAMVNFSSLIPLPPEIPVSVSSNFSIGIGGKGGTGGTGDSVGVVNDGDILTRGDFSHGIVAQSIGGGGGAGGQSIAATANIGLPVGTPSPEIKIDFALAIGGSGGSGNDAGSVDVTQNGTIDTQGDGSHGILAQSLGGGGGIGGNARAMTLGLDGSEWTGGSTNPLEVSKTANISVGGSGGSSGHGGTVAVTNTGAITTRGADAHGIVAQSIGGGGGAGGGGYHGLDWEDLGVPPVLIPQYESSPLKFLEDAVVVVGGRGGASGNGSTVGIVNSGTVLTLGDGSFGILAQSIGGGGGMGGVGALGDGTVGVGGRGGASGNGGAVTVETSGTIETSGIAAHAVLAQSIGGGGGIGGNVDRGTSEFGLNPAFGQSGGSGGHGGLVTVNSSGDIVTRGIGANGIFAQSVGGGGGIGGGVGVGFGFAGSVGGDGSGGAVRVEHTGSITTYGSTSHGIVAQSSGGMANPASNDRADVGSAVNVRVDGDVLAYGANSHGIVAQSIGGDGNGSITVEIEEGLVQGGQGTGTGVLFLDGAANRLENHGTITTVAGIEGSAIRGTGGSEAIDNFGLVTGLVKLGGGSNSFFNHEGGVFEAGSVVELGSGGRLTNAGVFSPGGSSVVTTELQGDFVQTGTGTFEVTVCGDALDRLIVLEGYASLDGTLEVVADREAYVDGTTYDILEASEVTGTFDDVVLPETAFLDFDMEYLSGGGVRLTVDVTSFSEAATTSMGRKIAGVLDECVTDASGDMSRMIGQFQLASPEQVQEAFYSLSPASYDNLTRGAAQSARLHQDGLTQRMDVARSRPTLEWAASTGRSYGGGRGWWLGGAYLGADQDPSGGYLEQQFSTTGALGGYEHADARTILGGSLGYSNAEVELANDHADGTANAYYGSLYGGRLWGATFVQSVLTLAKDDFENRRDVHVGAEEREARGDYSGLSFVGLVTGGRRMAAGSWGIEPFGTLQYGSVSEDGFAETGAGGANLILEDRTASWLASDLGVRFTTSIMKERSAILPEFRVAWNHDFGISDREIAAAFEAEPDMSFTIPGQELDSDGVTAGVGLAYQSMGGWKASVRYDHGQRGDYQSNSFTLRIGSGF